MSARRLTLTACLALAVMTVLALATPAFASAPPGTVLWSHTFGSTPTADGFYDAARCLDGGVVAVGFTNFDELVPQSFDGLICKYGVDGTLQWSHAFDNGETREDRFAAVAVDGAGNIYAGGWTDSALTGLDYLVVKYDKAGLQKWAMPIDGGRSLADSMRALVLDASGRPCVTGFSTTATGSQLFTVRLRPFDGDVLAKSRYNGPKGTKYVDAWGIDRGDHGSLLIAGQIGSAASVDRALVVRLTTRLHLKWAHTFKPKAGGGTSGEAVRRGPSGTLFVLAGSDLPASGTDTFLLKYSAAGKRLFAKRYDSGGGANDRPFGLAVDGAGNVFTTGKASSATTTRAFVIKWSIAGKRRWVRAYPSVAGDFSEYRDLLPDQKGGVYVAGQTKPSATIDRNGLVRHIRSTGALAWSAVSVHSPGDDSFEALAFCGSSGVCAVGRYLASFGPADQDAIIDKRQK